MHVSDHILELYALNSKSLDKKERASIHEHLTSCPECRHVMNYFAEIWSSNIHLHARNLNHFQFEFDKSPMVLAAATPSVKESKLKHLTNCLSRDNNWSVQFFSDETDDSILIYLVSDSSEDLSPLILRISGINHNIVIENNKSIKVAKSAFEKIQHWSELDVWILKPAGMITFEDVHMIEQSGDLLLFNTHRVRATLAIHKTPRIQHQWLNVESPGVFSANVSVWSPDSVIWYYE